MCPLSFYVSLRFFSTEKFLSSQTSSLSYLVQNSSGPERTIINSIHYTIEYTMTMSETGWSEETDLYGDLSLGQYATETEIRKAYRQLILIHHPDKQQPGQEHADAAPFRKVSRFFVLVHYSL